jgi:teichuronic acid biosynthesis glycosyltransferase TuaC
MSIRVLFLASMLPNSFEKLSAPWNIRAITALQYWEKATVKAICPIRLTPPETLVFRFPPDFDEIKQWHNIRYSAPEHLQYENIDITYLKWYGLPSRYFWSIDGHNMYLQLRKSLANIVKEFRPDVIHVPWLNPEGVAGCLLGQEFNIPCVVHSIGADINFYLRHSIGRDLVIKDLQKAAALLTNCQELKNTAIRLGLTHRNQRVVYFGVDVDVFKPTLKLRSRTIKTIVSVANLIPRKNIGLLLNAYKQLPLEIQNDTRLVLVGDGPCRQNLEEQARNLEILSKVNFTGHVSYADLVPYYQESALFCLPSLSEGLPCVALEAMACGLPVVATKVDGVPEAVIEGATGFTVEPGNVTAFASAMQIALSRQWDPVSIRGFVLSKFTWEKYANNMLNIYQQII